MLVSDRAANRPPREFPARSTRGTPLTRNRAVAPDLGAGHRPIAKNIDVGNIPYETTGDDLVELFQPYGAVNSAQVIIDKSSNRSRGFGFVEMADDAESAAAIEALSGADYGGRPWTVNEPKPREDRGGGGRGGFGGGGGYGGEYRSVPRVNRIVYLRRWVAGPKRSVAWA